MLDLSNNQLTQLHTEIFQSLAVLQKLIVSNNKLTSLDFVCNSALPRLSQVIARKLNTLYIIEYCHTSYTMVHLGKIFIPLVKLGQTIDLKLVERLFR